MVASAILVAGLLMALAWSSRKHAGATRAVPVVAPAPAAGDGGAPIAGDAIPSRVDAGRAADPPPLGNATIIGQISDESGRAVAGARLRAVGEDAVGTPVMVPAPPLGSAAGRVEPGGELGVLRGPIPFPPPAPTAPAALAASPIASDGSGRFEIAGLPAGRYAVLATHDQFVDGKTEAVALVEGGRAEVRLILSRGLAVRGRVVDERGQPIAGAELWRGGELAATTDARGAFAVDRLSGPTAFEIRGAGRLPTTRTIDPASDGDLEIALAPAAGRLSGAVLDERGFPVGGARVGVVAGTFHKEAISGARGDFSIEGAPAGKLAVTVRHADHPTATFEGEAGVELRAALLAGSGVEGEVRDGRTGACPLGVRVTLESGDTSRSASVDKRGRFRALGCPPGPASLRATAPGYLPVTLAVEVPAAEGAREITLRDLRLELTLAGSISGELRDDRGAPLRGVEVEAGGVTARTDAAGRFRLAPVAAGRVAVRAGAAEEEVLVEPGRDARVELRAR